MMRVWWQISATGGHCSAHKLNKTDLDVFLHLHLTGQKKHTFTGFSKNRLDEDLSTSHLRVMSRPPRRQDAEEKNQK